MFNKIIINFLWRFYTVTAILLFSSGCELFNDIPYRDDHVEGRDTPLLLPETPTGVAAVGSDRQVDISWQPVIDADSYNIYWSNGISLTTASGTKISVTGETYTHTGLINNVGYYYIVTAVNSMGEGPPSGVSGATPNIPVPGTPTGVSASPGDASVTLVWNSVAGASSYNIYWDAATGVTTNSNKLSNKTSPFVHSGPLVTNGTAYFYVVAAVNSAGEAVSTEVSAIPHMTSMIHYSGTFALLQESISAGGSVVIYASGVLNTTVTARNVLGQPAAGEKSTSANFINYPGFIH